MKKLWIGFSKPKNIHLPLFAWIIMWLYKTKYSHTYARFVRKTGTQFVYESVGKGTRFISITNWLKHAEVVEEFEIEVTEDQYNEIIDVCILSLGNDYGLIQAIGVGLIKAFKRWFGLQIHNPFREPDKEICAEAIARILGMDVSLYEEISPEDINIYLRELHEERKG